VTAEVRIGISGWRYAPWRGTFYPKGLVQARELAYAAERLNSIEINGSFYALQRPESYRQWADQTPDDFVFSVKGGRFITHMKKLRDVEIPLANFFASGVLALGPKLGPMLWQLPPNLGFDPDRTQRFLDLLPRTTTQAAELATQHDERMKDRAWTTTDADRPLRHAIEVRHASFVVPEFIEMLRAANVALVVADTAKRFPYLSDVTADFVYVRLHGDEELYVSGYGEEALDAWAERVRSWNSGNVPKDEQTVTTPLPKKKAGRNVYIYFDNDVKTHAPYDAMALAARVGAFPPPAGSGSNGSAVSSRETGTS
jgi:uncharacterized protein YecE (DUF72 family)